MEEVRAEPPRLHCPNCHREIPHPGECEVCGWTDLVHDTEKKVERLTRGKRTWSR